MQYFDKIKIYLKTNKNNLELICIAGAWISEKIHWNFQSW